MNEIYFNQKINCEVEDCQYCNNEDNTCTLTKIIIQNKLNKEQCIKENTLCGSYQKRNIKK